MSAYLVADTKGRLPYRSASVVALLNVFAPRNPVEFARIIAPGGALVIVIPTAQHLKQLRATVPLLGIHPRKRERIMEQFGDYFSVVATVAVEDEIVLDSAALIDLVQMSPNFWHMTDALEMYISRIERLQTLMSCEVLVLQRRMAEIGTQLKPR